MELDVGNYHRKLKIYLFFTIWNHGNRGTLFLFNTYECKKNSSKNPFDPILSFGLIKDFWKWNFLLLKKFTKDFQKTRIIKVSWW
jgi:hypothetical protein